MSEIVTSTSLKNIRHADDFKEQMTLISNAAIGVVLLRTRELYRCQEVLHEWAAEQELAFKVWTPNTGWQTFPTGEDPSDDGEIDLTKPASVTSDVAVDKAFKLIDDAGKSRDVDDPTLYIFLCIQYAFSSYILQQYIRVQVQRSLNMRQRVILLVPEHVEIPPEMESDLYIVDFKTPSHAELRTLYDDMLEAVKDDVRLDFSDEDVDLIVQNSVGMTAHEFETALAMAYVELSESIRDEEDVTPQDFIRIVLRSKVEVIKKTDILELMPEASMDEIGGLDTLKDWLSVRRTAFSDEARDFGVDAPKGVLVVGPPGTGKSLFGKAAAAVLGIPCIKFDIGRVFGQYVGQSEGRTRKALNLVEAMAPCCLLIDEIDKGLGGIGGGGDSGTTSRVFGTILTWMQERESAKAPVFIVMTANNIQGMPPELMRRGRVDEIFAATFPNTYDRAEIFKIHVEKRGHKLTEKDYIKLAQATENFVGAEIEACVKDALTEAFARDDKKITVDNIMEQSRQIIPISRAFPEKVSMMNEWAKNNAKAASSGQTFDPELLADTKKRGGKDVIRRPRKKRIRRTSSSVLDS